MLLITESLDAERIAGGNNNAEDPLGAKGDYAFGAWGCLKWWQSSMCRFPEEKMYIGRLTLMALQPDDNCAYALPASRDAWTSKQRTTAG